MFLTYILPGLILVSAVVDDLCSKKIHNWLILSWLGVVLSILVGQVLLGVLPLVGLLYALKNFVIALGVTIPLTLLKVIGGGDMKLFALLALILPPRLLFMSFFCALIWGAVLGVLKVILDKKAGLMYVNLMSLLKFKKLSADTLHGFPFSISLLLGWLSAFYF